jgi:hypothetical protein
MLKFGTNLSLVYEFSTGFRTPINQEITGPFRMFFSFFIIISTEINQPLNLRSESDVAMLTVNRVADCNYGAA